MMRAKRLPLLLAGLATLSGPIAGCGGSQLPPDTVRDAQCAGIRAMYDAAQTELINRGQCDDAASVGECLPHIAIREALIISLTEAQCPGR